MILDKIENLYYDDDLESKQKDLLNLWTKYYQLSSSYNIELSRAYDLYLLIISSTTLSSCDIQPASPTNKFGFVCLKCLILHRNPKVLL